MIFVKIYGGLGNQIFQFAKALDVRGQSNSIIAINCEFIGEYSTIRGFELGNIFNLPKYVKQGHQNYFSKFLFRCRIQILLNKIFNYFNINIDRLNFFNNIYLDGYYQDVINSKNYKYIINTLNSFYTYNKNNKELHLNDDICIMHIRGGDFLLSKNHHICNINYYLNAINNILIRSKIINIQVITDDKNYSSDIISKLKNYFPHIKFTIRDSVSYEEDFEIIRICKFKIIGNSTFAWWAAALGPADALILSPSKWTNSVSKLFFLPSEICIEI